ncbi:MAG: ATP-dependent RecD-like DNA helicase [bacterium]|nr:ATP-dependent RecD-like DNA helicase [bacterium]
MPYVEGLIRQVLFFAEDSGYSVIKLEITDTTEHSLLYHEPTIVISGFFPRLETQVKYRFSGAFVDHPKYGTQYKATTFERIMDNTIEGIIEYLASGLFKGIGHKTAKKIVDVLGVTCLDQIANDVSVLDSVKKMPASKKQEIYETLRKNRQLESTLIWLYGFEISPKMSFRIVQKYGPRTIDTLKHNPYILIDDVEGIGFKRADDIGLKMGVEVSSPLRIRAVIYYLLTEYMNKFGDTLIDKFKLMEYTLSFLNRTEEIVTLEQVQDIIADLIFEDRLVEIGDVIMLSYLYRAEMELAKKVRLLSSMEESIYEDGFLEETLHHYEQDHFITYTDNQRHAILSSLKHHLVIITGGPGTGKTTIIKAIVDILELIHKTEPMYKKSIKLIAPTGKAAKRLMEATSFEASTIHRLLGYDFSGIFQYDEHNPIDASCVIVDEASMMDVMLAKHLFQAIHPKTKVIIVGDENQLPSVGPGQVLSDLLSASICPVIRLTKIHRQATDSKIIEIAYHVLNQELPESILKQTDDFHFIKSKETEVLRFITDTVHHALLQGQDLHEDIQILIPMYKGPCGIDVVNEHIQATFNKQNALNKIVFGTKTFCLDDKVIQLLNNPEDGVMNGDIGKVIAIVEGVEMIVEFNSQQVKYSLKDLDNLQLAYAVSVHKSQGSEFKTVILPLVPGFRHMLKRKLLYTAITRAKKHLVIIGDLYSLRNGIFGLEPIRNTLLRHWLEQNIDITAPREPSLDDFMQD